MLGYRLVLVTLHRSLQLVLSKTIRIGETKYHIWCSGGDDKSVQTKLDLVELYTNFEFANVWLTPLLSGKWNEFSVSESDQI